MRTKLALAVLLVAACGGSNETSPAGPVGKPIDLRSRITKPDVAARAPADDKAAVHEHALDVHGVKAKVVWRTFEDSGAQYILSAGWEVVTPSKGITLEPQGVLNPVNAGTVAAPVQSEIMRVRWRDNTSSDIRFGDMSVRIDATGQASAI
ncbi:MAG TPA: hypothetical protein VNO30_48445 [Kofleriaceae bacterium]|nr:hypothetical protein [Kofleriaceae bacterium]